MFVRLWMTKDPVTILEKQTVAEVLTLFQENDFRLLPVVGESGKLVGILSQRDAFNLRPSLLDGSAAGSSSALLTNTKVEEIMIPQPLSVDPLTPLEAVAKTMKKEKIGGMPVLEDGILVGIITESDIFTAFAEVLGVDSLGVRIEMIISKSIKDIYVVLDVLKKHGVNLLNIALHNDFGENQRLLTVKLAGDDVDDAIESLRDKNVQINRVIED